LDNVELLKADCQLEGSRLGDSSHTPP
jgi:hypothetical protein